jgi:hypothetical protein
VRVRIEVGSVKVSITGLDLTRREVRRLLMDAAGIAATLGPEEQESPPFGFAAPVLERLPDEMAAEPGEGDE